MSSIPTQPPAGAEPGEIGAQVRRRRRALGLTLEQLAGRSGVSATMLSEVERSVKNPTVKLAYQIARALGCSLTDLLGEDASAAAQVVRAADRRLLLDEDTGVARYALAPEMLRRGLELVSYTLPPHSSAGDMAPNRAGILEHVYVVRGELSVVLGGSAQRLAAADGMTYGPQTTVEYRNDGDQECEFVLLSDGSRAL